MLHMPSVYSRLQVFVYFLMSVKAAPLVELARRFGFDSGKEKRNIVHFSKGYAC